MVRPTAAQGRCDARFIEHDIFMNDLPQMKRRHYEGVASDREFDSEALERLAAAQRALIEDRDDGWLEDPTAHLALKTGALPPKPFLSHSDCNASDTKKTLIFCAQQRGVRVIICSVLPKDSLPCFGGRSMVPSSGSTSGFRTSSSLPSRKRLDIPAASTDYRILDLSLIASPSTTNFPYP